MALKRQYGGRTAYVDSSVILRVVLGEPEPLRAWRVIPRMVASAIAEVECLRTLDRLRHVGRLPEEELPIRRATALKLLTRIDLVVLTPPILSHASNPFPTPLQTLDALHLASAMLWREQEGDILFATHDGQLATAARAVGFEVIGA